MSIRSLIVKIGADTQAIDKALADVGTSSKNLADGLKKLGDTPIGKQAQASAEQLKKNLDAVNASIQRTADLGVNAAKGIDAIGGPAKLTTSQLGVMNKAVQDSLDAFRALGQQAPQELQKVAAALQAQQKALTASLVPASSQNTLQSALGQLPGASLIGGGLAGIVAASGTALALAAKQALSYADSLEKLKDRTGIGEVALQRLEAIATASGNSLEDVANGVNQFQRRLVTGDATKALDSLGLSVSQLEQLKPDEQFIAIANAIQKIQDPAQQTALAIALFGKSGAELLPSLKANVDQLADSTVQMSAESVQALDKFGDGITALGKSLRALIGEFAGKTITITLKVLRAIDNPKPGDVGVNGAGFDFGAAAPVVLPKLPGSPIDISSGTEATRILSAALAEETARMEALQRVASSLGITIQEFEQRQNAANVKLIEANAPLVTLNDRQIKLVESYRALGLSNTDIATKLEISTRSVDKFTTEIDALHASLNRIQQGGGITGPIFGLQKFDANAEIKPFEDFFNKLTAIENGTFKAFRDPALLNGPIEGLELVKPEAPERIKNATDGLDELSKAFSHLAQIAGGSLATVVRGIGSVVSTIDLGKKSIAHMSDQFDEAGKLIHSASFFDKLSGATGIVSAGIQIGQTLIQGIQQALEHLELSRIGHDVGRDLGVAITEGTEQAIRDSEKQLANAFIQTLEQSGVPDTVARLIADPKKFREAATAMNLPKIIADAGGIQGFGTEKAITQLHDLFSRLEQGKLTIGQVGSVFEDVFGQLIPNAISKVSGLASASFVELEQTALRHNLQSPALDQFRSQQIGNVNTGLTSTLGVNADATAKALDLQKQLNDARGKGDSDEAKAVAQIIDLQAKLDKESNNDKRAAIQAQINDLIRRGATDYSNVVALQKELDKQQNLINATTIRSQAAATGFAGALLASFNELSRQGVPITEIFKQIGPNILALQQQLDRTGFTGGAAFDKIKDLAALASDELAGPALDGVSGIQQALAGLANTGGLDADTFSGLAASVGDTFRSLVDQGKDGNQVLKLMAPTLQTIFELQERTGFAVDETTANLIAQAKAQGLVGDQFKSADERQVDSLNKIADILTAIAKQLGVDLPNAADDMAAGVSDALKHIPTNIETNVDVNVTRHFKDDNGGGGDNTVATGGLVTAHGIQHFAAGGRVLPFIPRGSDVVPAMLTPGEVVLNANQQRAIGALIGAGAARVTIGNVNVNATGADLQDMARFAPKFIEALRVDTGGMRSAIERVG